MTSRYPDWVCPGCNMSTIMGEYTLANNGKCRNCWVCPGCGITGKTRLIHPVENNNKCQKCYESLIVKLTKTVDDNGMISWRTKPY